MDPLRTSFTPTPLSTKEDNKAMAIISIVLFCVYLVFKPEIESIARMVRAKLINVTKKCKVEKEAE